MRSKFLLALLGCLFVFSSCGKAEKEENKIDINSIPLELIVEHKYQNDDVFKVFYSKDGTTIDGTTEMTTPVKGSENFQETVFVFPKGVFPKIIRLDVGNYPDAKMIEIKSIKLKHGETVIDNTDWVKNVNWSSNEGLKSNSKNPTVFEIIPVDGKNIPVFMSNIVISEKITGFCEKNK